MTPTERISFIKASPVLYAFTFSNSCLSIAALLSRFGKAKPGAVISLDPVVDKLTSAKAADVFIPGRVLSVFRVTSPPRKTALVRAKPATLFMRDNTHSRPALKAEARLLQLIRMPFAPALDRAERYSKRRRYCLVPLPFPLQADDFFRLVCRHKNASFTIRRFRGRFEGVFIENNYRFVCRDFNLFRFFQFYTESYRSYWPDP